MMDKKLISDTIRVLKQQLIDTKYEEATLKEELDKSKIKRYKLEGALDVSTQILESLEADKKEVEDSQSSEESSRSSKAPSKKS